LVEADIGNVGVVYPVIVTRDDLGSVVGINAYLDSRFRAVVQRNRIRVSIAPLISMSSETLEQV
jgi:hypothetical protein